LAGHSKWANIKHKKQKEDKRRSKLFSKLSRRIAVAARKGGGDPEFNPTLRMEIERAKDNNMPNDNIERAIKRGTGELEGVKYEEVVYEGYGPSGVALYIELMTDNRNRTASEIRRILSDHGGNLGEDGCVEWLFERKGFLSIDRQNTDLNEEEIMLEAIELGAEDVSADEDFIEIYTSPSDFEDVKQGFQKQGFEFTTSKLTMMPQNSVELNGSEAKKILRLLDKLEDHDDVQEIYSNFDIPDHIMVDIEAN